MSTSAAWSVGAGEWSALRAVGLRRAAQDLAWYFTIAPGLLDVKASGFEPGASVVWDDERIWGLYQGAERRMVPARRAAQVGRVLGELAAIDQRVLRARFESHGEDRLVIATAFALAGEPGSTLSVGAMLARDYSGPLEVLVECAWTTQANAEEAAKRARDSAEARGSVTREIERVARRGRAWCVYDVFDVWARECPRRLAPFKADARAAWRHALLMYADANDRLRERART